MSAGSEALAFVLEDGQCCGECDGLSFRDRAEEVQSQVQIPGGNRSQAGTVGDQCQQRFCHRRWNRDTGEQSWHSASPAAADFVDGEDRWDANFRVR